MLIKDYVLFAAVFAAAGGIYIGLAIKKKQLTKDRIINMVLRWAFAGYLCFIAAVTLFPITLPPCRMPFITPSVNLDPGMLFIYSDAYHMIVNIAGNLLLFAPGVILGRLCRIKVLESWQSTLAAGAVISVLIEVMQYCETVWGFTDMPRTSDINDVALNTAGAVIGWLVFRLFDKGKNLLRFKRENTKGKESCCDKEKSCGNRYCCCVCSSSAGAV